MGEISDNIKFWETEIDSLNNERDELEERYRVLEEKLEDIVEEVNEIDSRLRDAEKQLSNAQSFREEFENCFQEDLEEMGLDEMSAEIISNELAEDL